MTDSVNVEGRPLIVPETLYRQLQNSSRFKHLCEQGKVVPNLPMPAILEPKP